MLTLRTGSSREAADSLDRVRGVRPARRRTGVLEQNDDAVGCIGGRERERATINVLLVLEAGVDRIRGAFVRRAGSARVDLGGRAVCDQRARTVNVSGTSCRDRCKQSTGPGLTCSDDREDSGAWNSSDIDLPTDASRERVGPNCADRDGLLPDARHRPGSNSVTVDDARTKKGPSPRSATDVEIF